MTIHFPWKSNKIATVVNARDLDRYKRLLLAKLDELSAARGGAETPVPRAGVEHGDLVDQADSDAEAELQIRVHQSDAHLLRAIEEALARIRQGTFGVCQAGKQPKILGLGPPQLLESALR